MSKRDLSFYNIKANEIFKKEEEKPKEELKEEPKRARVGRPFLEDKKLSSAYSQIESQENNLSSVFEEESSAASYVSVVDEEYAECLSKFIINFDFSNTILPVEKTFNEDGRELFKIGHDYEFYEVDKTYRIAIEGGVYIQYLETLQLDLLSRES